MEMRDKMTTKSVRWFTISMTVLLTSAATISYAIVVSGGRGTNLFEALTIGLFGVLFGWIAFSFQLATIGFLSLVHHRRLLPAAQTERTEAQTERTEAQADGVDSNRILSSRTAILMPIYNESPDRVYAGIQAMIQDLRRLGAAEHFDFYVLSDTTRHEVWLQEELAWSERFADATDTRVFYRHRPKNLARKAGNIADFCTRWAAPYPFMVVLDADSLMQAETLVEMVRRMDADPKLGILQVPPTPIGRQSLFAKIQQFAAQAYGPIFVKGFSMWSGDEGNYWGHNAIIRVEPFLRHCDLPRLPGREPLGGEILSHDFVEAALMVRAGWKVRITTDLSGSYEECPTTLADYAQRDQRWCQGNLQHSKLLVAENFRWLSRAHMTSGVMSYLASPLWVVFTILCLSGMAVEDLSDGGFGSTGFSGRYGAIVLFSVSMLLLLIPKLWGITLLLLDRARANQFAGRSRLIASGFIESVLSVLLSPIMAVFHSVFVCSTLLGMKVRWSAQQRDECNVGWVEAVHQFAPFMLLGLSIWTVLIWFASGLVMWFAPIIAGLVVSIPLAKALGSARVGRYCTAVGLLAIPEETSPPDVVVFHREALRQAACENQPDTETIFSRFIHEPSLHLLHQRIQHASEAHVSIDGSVAARVRSAVIAGGPAAIPMEYRSAVLLDPAVLRELHVESQLHAFAGDPVATI